jgi:hypothetical protein
MKIVVTEDGKPMFNQKDLNCFTRSLLENNKIVIMGYMPEQPGWGFQLVVYGDSCIIASFAQTDRMLYKRKPSDSDLLYFITLPSTTKKLILSKKPAFSKNEKFTGYVELKSEDFYYINKGIPTKAFITLTAFFKTTILK